MDNIVYVDNRKGLSLVKESLRNSKIIGVDTEFIKISTLHPIPALIQLYDGAAVYLVDPVGLSAEENQDFWDAFISSEALYLIFAMHEDLELIHLCSGKLPKNICDLQFMAPYIGMKPSQGLAATAKALLGLEIIKDQTTSIWLNRPLTSDQLRYAAEDVLHLPEMYDKLYPRLQSSGMEPYFWSDMELNKTRLDDVGAEFEYLHYITDNMTVQQRAKLRELTLLRRRLAEESNIPLQFVISNKILPVLAVRTCRNNNSLGIAGLHWKSVRNYGSEILKVLNGKCHDCAGIYKGNIHVLSAKGNSVMLKALESFKKWSDQHQVTYQLCATKRLVKEWVIWQLCEDRNTLPVPLIELSEWRRKIMEENKVLDCESEDFSQEEALAG